MKNKKQTYFLTGAAGFVGSNILRRLLLNNEHVAIVLKKDTNTWRIDDLLKKKNVDVYECDLTEEKKLQKIITKVQPEIIYHLAARGAYPTQNNPKEIFQSNIFGTLNLLQATDHIPYRLFVNTGSTSEYGFKKSPMKETDVLEPASYYAVAKVTSTLLCQYEAIAKKKPIVSARLFSAYGPYEGPTRLIPTIVRKAKNDEVIHLVSKKIARDFIYVDDVVDFYLNVEELSRHGGQYFNVGMGKQSTLSDVIKALEKIAGKKVACQWGTMEPRSWDTTHWVADMSYTKKVLGWKPKFSLEEGLRATWELHSRSKVY